MTLANDFRTLHQLVFAPVRGLTHRDRLESFYAKQADGYDDFRKRLLHGRRELYDSLPTPEGGVWVEMGGGTASNLEFLGERLGRLSHVHVVDLSASLLDVARRRCERLGWHNVRLQQDDATTLSLPASADVVTFSYALTMIPDWYLAIENAHRLLKPGGVLGVVDFYVSRKYPAAGRVRHGWFTRHFWPTWFASDNVHPNPDHVPYLHHRFEVTAFEERMARVPYLPLAKVPYYWFVGRKR
jgi:S-adenosylmethionine-diacylgycerolhomoserine-N-methlytransferase